MDVLRLIARRRIRHLHIVRQFEAVPRSRDRLVGYKLVPAVSECGHRQCVAAALEDEPHALLRRRPKPEPDPSVGTQLRAERHGVGRGG